MQNSVLKLTALAGVVGLGFLVVYQAQQAMTRPSQQIDANGAFEALTGENGAEGDAGKQEPSPDDAYTDGADPHAFDQGDFDFGENTEPALHANHDHSDHVTEPQTGLDFRDTPEEDEFADTPNRNRSIGVVADAGDASFDTEDGEPFRSAHGDHDHADHDHADHEHSGHDRGEEAFNPFAETSDDDASPNMADNSVDHPESPEPADDTVPVRNVVPAGFGPDSDSQEAATPPEPIEQATPSFDDFPESEQSNEPEADGPALFGSSEDQSGVDDDAPPKLLPEAADEPSQPASPIGPTARAGLKNDPSPVDTQRFEPSTIDAAGSDDFQAKPNDFAADEPNDFSNEPIEPIPDAFGEIDQPAKPRADGADTTTANETGPDFGPQVQLNNEPSPVAQTPRSRSTDTGSRPDPDAFNPFEATDGEPSSFSPQEEPKTNTSADRGEVIDSETSDANSPVPSAVDTVDEPSPSRTDFPRERPSTALPTPDLQTRIGSPGDTQPPELLVDPSSPQPLRPAHDAAPIAQPHDDSLNGNGVVHDGAPTGSQKPQLKIEKRAPRNAVVGKPLIYNILVTNTGQSMASQVVVKDRIPKGTRLTGTIPRAELSDKQLSWKMGTLKPGEQRKISVRVIPITEGDIGSVATVNFVAEVAAETKIVVPKLSLDVSGPREVETGGRVTVRYKVSNDGTVDSRGVVVRSIIPAGLQHPAGRDLEYEIGTIAAGQSRELSLTLSAITPGTSTYHVVVTSADGAPVESKARLNVVGSQLAVTRSGPERPKLRATASFVNTVKNKSQRPAYGITLLEVVPEGFEFVGATGGGQYNAARRTIAWRIDHLPAHKSVRFGVKLVPQIAGAKTSTLTATERGGQRVQVSSIAKIDSAAPANSVAQVNGVIAVGLDVPPLPGPVNVGTRFTVRLIANNRGTIPGRNVKLNLEIPPELELLGVRGPSPFARTASGATIGPIGEIGPQARVAFDVTFRARAPGEARLKLVIGADHMQRPLTREESIVILAPGG